MGRPPIMQYRHIESTTQCRERWQFMSVEAMAIVLNHSRARGATKLVLIGIANHINPDNDGAWPSRERLAAYSNVSLRSVTSAIAELVELGEIHVEQAAGVSPSQYKPNRYWLTLTCPDDCDGSVSHKKRKADDDSGWKFSTVRVEVSDTQGGSTLPTNHNRTVNKPILSKATRIDPETIPKSEWVAWARNYRPALDADSELDNFIDYWTSKNGDATKRDWFATWRVWVRNSRQPAHRPPGEKKTNLQRNLELFEQMFGKENGEIE